MNKQNNNAFTASGVLPAKVINVAVDTQYLYSQTSGPYSGIGVYMMDNNAIGGSTGEGTNELTTTTVAFNGLAFNVFAIDSAGNAGDTVQIEGIEISSGTNIFGNWGYPKPAPAGSPYQWLSTPSTQGGCTYQLKLGITFPGQPKKYFWWDPFLNCIG